MCLVIFVYFFRVVILNFFIELNSVDLFFSSYVIPQVQEMGYYVRK